ncbi:DUF4082 domain-containing protein [Paenibacillus donghaensis]|nr:DUF4082 domain-containing protein [Paenibacillus donghaensis]
MINTFKFPINTSAPFSGNSSTTVAHRLRFSKNTTISALYWYRGNTTYAPIVTPRIYELSGKVIGTGNGTIESSFLLGWYRLPLTTPVELIANTDYLIGCFFSIGAPIGYSNLAVGNYTYDIGGDLSMTLSDGLYWSNGGSGVDVVPIRQGGGNLISIGFDGVSYNRKVLVFNKNQYKKYTNTWENISTNPIESDYISGNTLEQLSLIPESAWSQLTGNVELCYYTDDSTKTEAQFNIETTPFTLAEEWEDKEIKIIEYTDDPNQSESTITLETEPFSLYDELGDTVDVLYYTDDPSKTSANLNVTANYSPLDEIVGDFDVVTWTDDEDIAVGNEPTLEYGALPFEQLIIQPSDFSSYGTVKSFVASKIGDARLRFITSFDSGTTWKIYRFGKWRLINKADLLIVRKKGMSVDELNVIPEKDLIGANRLGYYLDNSIHNSAENVQLDYVKVSSLAPTQDVKFSDVAFYLLNTTATIQIALQGNKIVGTLDDTDTGRVQYRVILNGNPYYPASGDFSPLMPSPLNIRLNISEKDVVFGQDNTLKVEFQDYWGQTDFWQTTFVGTYSGIMFKDETGQFLSNSFGEILKHLDFGVVIAGQTTLEQKVIVKNQLGIQVQNLILEVQKEKLPEGVKIELSRSNFPFTPEDPLLFNMFFDENEEFEFYTRILTDIQAPPAANGEFEVRAKADPV